jgi:hypothetical protein
MQTSVCYLVPNTYFRPSAILFKRRLSNLPLRGDFPLIQAQSLSPSDTRLVIRSTRIQRYAHACRFWTCLSFIPSSRLMFWKKTVPVSLLLTTAEFDITAFHARIRRIGNQMSQAVSFADGTFFDLSRGNATR